MLAKRSTKALLPEAAETVAPERPVKTVGPEGRAVFSEILALFSGGKIAQALALGLSLPESVRGDPLVAIEIAKIARAGLNTSVMLEYGEIAFNAAPSNAPIGNT